MCWINSCVDVIMTGTKENVSAEKTQSGYTKSWITWTITTFLLWNTRKVTAASWKMETFKANYCEQSVLPEQSATLLKASYSECLDECRARDTCFGANYRPGTDTCSLNLGPSIPGTDCNSWMFSKKDEWDMKTLLPSCNCQAGEKCTTDSNGAPVCLFAECGGSLASVQNAILLGNRNGVNSKKKYKCDVTMTSVGQPTRTCLDSGQWSDSPMACGTVTATTSTTTSTSTSTTTTTTTTTTPTTTTTTPTTTTTTTTTPTTTTTTPTTTTTTTTTPTTTTTTPTTTTGVPFDGTCTWNPDNCHPPMECRTPILKCQCPFSKFYYNAATKDCSSICTTYGTTYQIFTSKYLTSFVVAATFQSVTSADDCQNKCASDAACTHAWLDHQNSYCKLSHSPLQGDSEVYGSQRDLIIRDCLSVG